MSPTTDLYNRLMAFSIDEGTPTLSFEHRLARENGWSVAFARRVVHEYKRFVYLAMTAGHMVTPSEEVDQAWHLHLVYTRSYWEHLCGEVLGRPLHHGPTRGGTDESTKYHDHYVQTLASYRTAFGEDAPRDIWPPAAKRFGDDLQVVRVNTVNNWIVPKAVLWRSAAVSVFAFAAIVFGTGCSGAIVNPFDLVGTDFLFLLIPALLAAFLIGRMLSWRLRGPSPQPGDEDVALDWVQTAYLAGGSARLLTTVIARLVAKGLARVSDDGKTLEQLVSLEDSPSSPEERAVWRALPLSRDKRSERDSLAQSLESISSEAVAAIKEAGYVIGAVRCFAAGFLAFLPVALVLCFLALPRLAHGLAGGKQVGYLVGMSIAAAALGLVSALLPCHRRSRRGQFVLRKLQKSHSKTVADAEPDTVGMAVGLFDTAVLTSCPFAELSTLNNWYPHQTTDSSGGSDGGGGCGGGGCGGGCGGCGGCGG